MTSFSNTAIFQTLTDPRYYPLSEPREEPDELSFDADVDPTEYECNTCGWRGQTPSRSNYPFGNEERRYCPACQKWNEAPEGWNLVAADPFEFPMLEAATSVADLQSEPVRKAAAAQLGLFEEVA
jgi:hypothetical protein